MTIQNFGVWLNLALLLDFAVRIWHLVVRLRHLVVRLRHLVVQLGRNLRRTRTMERH